MLMPWKINKIQEQTSLWRLSLCNLCDDACELKLGLHDGGKAPILSWNCSTKSFAQSPLQNQQPLTESKGKLPGLKKNAVNVPHQLAIRRSPLDSPSTL